MLLVGTVTFAQNRIINFNELPKLGKDFIIKYFGSENVKHIISDDDYFFNDYELVLTNGTEIEFNKDGEWKDIDGKKNRIPTAFIPKEITSYVNKSFPNTGIVKIEKERFKYSIELTNGLELDFNNKGKFLRIDS